MANIIIAGKRYENISKITFNTPTGGKATFVLQEEQPTLIKFSIKDPFFVQPGTVEYQAEEGMTFGEWLESEYNTDTDIAVSDGYIVKWGLWLWGGPNGVATINDVIESKTYAIDSNPPSEI